MIMTVRTFLFLVAATALSLAGFVTADAQTRAASRANRPTAPAVRAAAVPLPASDAVLMVDLRRLFDEAVPRALEGDQAKLAQVNADVEQFKTRTGIDPRAFDTVAVGARFSNPSASVTKIDHLVAVARGTFSPGALVAAGRLASQGKYEEQKHGGKSVYVFRLEEHVKLFGLLRMRVGELAVSALDANTLALGEPAAVRAAIDAAEGRGRADAELVKLASAQNAVVGFAGDVPRSLVEGLDLGNPELTRNVASIRRFYGSIATSPSGFQLMTALRTLSAKDAGSLSDTVEAVRQFAPALMGGLSGERGKLARSAVQNLKVTTQGNEVQLRLDLSQSELATLLRTL